VLVGVHESCKAILAAVEIDQMNEHAYSIIRLPFQQAVIASAETESHLFARHNQEILIG
jgi:hypothetical protein